MQRHNFKKSIQCCNQLYVNVKADSHNASVESLQLIDSFTCPSHWQKFQKVVNGIKALLSLTSFCWLWCIGFNYLFLWFLTVDDYNMSVNSISPCHLFFTFIVTLTIFMLHEMTFFLTVVFLRESSNMLVMKGNFFPLISNFCRNALMLSKWACMGEGGVENDFSPQWAGCMHAWQ